jgi:hypothetical protein
MPVLGGKKYARDYANAKKAFTGWINHYSHLIIPGVPFKLKYKILNPSIDSWGEVFDDGESELVVNSLFLEANMYNLGSEAVRMLPVHELCHIKVFLEDLYAWLDLGNLDADEHIHTHADPRFRGCVTDYFNIRHSMTGPHPGRLSFRNYFGSEAGVVPPDIFFIYSYYCPACDETWDENSLRRYKRMIEPKTCVSCGGPVEKVKHLTPRDILRFDIPDDLMVYDA